MKRFEVWWRFAGEHTSPHTSIVVARDKGHAKERVWLMHIAYGELRQQIEFIEIEEIE